MNEHPDAFLKEIAQVFSCYKQAVHKALLRNDYTLKKDEILQRNAIDLLAVLNSFDYTLMKAE